MSVAESEWDDESRNWALALDDFEADQCPGCGGQLSQTRKRPEGDPQPLFEISTIVCARCEDTASVQKSHQDADEQRRKAGARVNDAGRLYVARYRGMTTPTVPSYGAGSPNT